MAQVEHDVLGEWREPVVACRLVNEVEYLEDLGPLEAAADLDRDHLPARVSISASSSVRVETVASSGRAGTNR